MNIKREFVRSDLEANLPSPSNAERPRKSLESIEEDLCVRFELETTGLEFQFDSIMPIRHVHLPAAKLDRLYIFQNQD